MTGCFTWLILLALAVAAMVSLIRWFEQITDAVDAGHWSRVALLLTVPLTVWCFESKVSAGRPTPVPHHEPVRGFGAAPVMPSESPKKNRPAVEPDAVAKLKQKMKEQGMLDDDSDSPT